uniref:HMG box domain-containing protein n=1 Tax=Steinernema glaseri TaxID=37863 RepID=A0A1I7YY54_9BILA
MASPKCQFPLTVFYVVLYLAKKKYAEPSHGKSIILEPMKEWQKKARRSP